MWYRSLARGVAGFSSPRLLAPRASVGLRRPRVIAERLEELDEFGQVLG
jgi:hypothetical protein